MPAITLPENFEYVAGGLLSTLWVLAYQNTVVSRHRKAAGIKYPQAYAEKAEAESSLVAKKFNCAQRAHQNTLENIPPLYVAALITSLKYPIFAASALGVWSVSRILYTIGYVSGDPAKRNSRGSWIGSLTVLGLFCSSNYIIGKAILDKLL